MAPLRDMASDALYMFESFVVILGVVDEKPPPAAVILYDKLLL